MLQMLAELTKGWFFMHMSEFEDYFLNGAEVLKAIDANGCVEFGTDNGQEILIYDLANDGRKHIRYSCSFTELFNFPIIENAYSKQGNEYTGFNYDKWYFKAALKDGSRKAKKYARKSDYCKVKEKKMA